MTHAGETRTALATSFVIRLARATELEGLQDVERAASVLFPAGRLPDPDDVMPLEDLEAARRGGLALVAERAGSIAGFAVARAYEDALYLAVMAVRPEVGRQGAGTALVSAVQQEAARRGCTRVTLTTFADLPFNAPFYRRLGFHTLAPDQLDERLAATLERERQLGFTERVAMSCSLSSGLQGLADG